MRYKIPPAAAALAAISFVPSAVRAQLPEVELNAGIHVVRAEVANTDATRRRGLMERTHLEANQGMLFVFDAPSRLCMWMKNTLIPLSVAFIDEKGAVINIADMAPQTETSHCAARPARYALEMSQGWFARKGIAAGARIQGLERAPGRQ